MQNLDYSLNQNQKITAINVVSNIVIFFRKILVVDYLLGRFVNKRIQCAQTVAFLRCFSVFSCRIIQFDFNIGCLLLQNKIKFLINLFTSMFGSDAVSCNFCGLLAKSLSVLLMSGKEGSKTSV